jgi:hypothetical protein
MLLSKICIIIGGILSLGMVLFHTQFYKLFDWKKEFEKISNINQKVFYTIHLALLLLFLTFSFISFAYTAELSQCNGLTCGITLGYSLFWLWRTIWQMIYFRPPKNQKAGKMTFLHYMLIIVFGILFVVYLAPFMTLLI